MIKSVLRSAFATGIILSLSAGIVSAEEAKPKKEPSAAQTALRERQKACGAEWKANKASGKVEAGMKWPKFWSACNTRLKAEKKA